MQSANRPSAATAIARFVDRGQQQDADAGAAAHPVHEADPVGLQRRARAPGRVVVRVEGAAVPAQEQRDRERDDHEADGRLGGLLRRLGQVALEEHDRQAEGEQRRRVAEAPGRARAGRPRRWRARECRRSASRRRRGGRDRSRGGGRARRRRRRRARASRRRRTMRSRCRVRTWSAHFRDGADGHGEPRREDDECAGGWQEPNQPAFEGHAAEGRAGENRREADAGDREREPRAEGEDQQQPEGDAVQRDRREQDDERRGARQQAARDADGEQRAEARALARRGGGDGGGGAGCAASARAAPRRRCRRRAGPRRGSATGRAGRGR